MNENKLLYEIGITLVHGIGNITARQIVERLGDVSLLFKEKKRILEKIPGLSSRIISEIHKPEVLIRAEKEMRFIEKNKIDTFFISDFEYPQRMKECVDAPVIIYYKGNVSLNSQKIISIVGTRKATAYAKDIIDRFIEDLKSNFPDTIIVSGLAYGVDILAHKAALKENMNTVAVLAHGLDRIYPPGHRNVAQEMLSRGGLVTEYLSETNPDKSNFVKRNRIIAGISDCTLVIESADKGGALITANIADSYNRDVFAFPGRISDKYSQGCNSLIKYRKATMLTCADDLFREMSWKIKDVSTKKAFQRTLMLDLSEDEQRIVDILQVNSQQLNSLCIELNIPIHKLSPLLFDMEMKGYIKCLPGGMYQLN